jgi:hypothetical protein
MECKSKLIEKLNGSRNRNVIIEVGRSNTANDANIRDSVILLLLAWLEKVYLEECVDEMWERDGHGQYKSAPAVKVVSREFENVRVRVNQFHTDVTEQNNCY